MKRGNDLLHISQLSDGCFVCRQVRCRLHLTLSGTADPFSGELPHSPTTVAAGNTQRQSEYNVQNKARVGDSGAKGGPGVKCAFDLNSSVNH